MMRRCLPVYRVKKLKETLVTVEQLDKNMSNLRSWLSRVEAELSRPITYSVCHQREIQRRLAEQQVQTQTQDAVIYRAKIKINKQIQESKVHSTFNMF